MKIVFLLGGFLLISFGEYVESRDFLNWQDKLEADLGRMQKRLEEESEARQERFEADAKRRDEKLNALWKRLEEDAKGRERKSKAFWEKFQAELIDLKQKCAKKGFSNDDEDYFKGTSTFTNNIDGFRHIYLHTYNSVTKNVSGSYYRVNEKDPAAEPICGILEIEQPSDDHMSKNLISDAHPNGDVIAGIDINGYQHEDEIVELGQKCAAKGFPNDIVGAKRMVTIMTTIDGIRHTYLQTYNSATKKVSGSYFRVDKNGELSCGKLKVESSS